MELHDRWYSTVIVKCLIRMFLRMCFPFSFIKGISHHLSNCVSVWIYSASRPPSHATLNSSHVQNCITSVNKLTGRPFNQAMHYLWTHTSIYTTYILTLYTQCHTCTDTDTHLYMHIHLHTLVTGSYTLNQSIIDFCRLLRQ